MKFWLLPNFEFYLLLFGWYSTDRFHENTILVWFFLVWLSTGRLCCFQGLKKNELILCKQFLYIMICHKKVNSVFTCFLTALRIFWSEEFFFDGLIDTTDKGDAECNLLALVLDATELFDCWLQTKSLLDAFLSGKGLF